MVHPQIPDMPKADPQGMMTYGMSPYEFYH